MGVIETGAIFNGFTFDGENSKDYGVYITGSGVFNAPERDVEMISIPGRDGAFAQDLGRFSNIEVTYPAGLFGVDKSEFATAISDFRNMLASRKGYCRLEDDYNPGEYRMAVFKAGVDVSPASLESGEFSITFDCKPQRWLTSGETAVALSSGDDITNPTLFDARPELQVWGYGDIDLGGQAVSVSNVALGNITLDAGGSDINEYVVQFDGTLLNIGDSINISKVTFDYTGWPDASTWTLGTWTKSKDHEDFTITQYTASGYNDIANMTIRSDNVQLTKGTAYSGYGEISMAIQTSVNGGAATTNTLTLRGTIVYDGNGTITMTATLTAVGGTWLTGPRVNALTTTANSTVSALGNPLYIDLDIGEAYKLVNGEPVSSNNGVTIPAELPALAPGNTTITYDNTITQFKVVPRWWKV